MAAQSVPVYVPARLYHRLERLAALTGRPVEELVEQILSSTLPPLPNDLPAPMQAALVSLESLDDEQLWQIVRSYVPPEQQRELATLQDKHRAGTLTQAEAAALARLHQAADTLMVRKGYAAVLLKWRGHRLPTLRELEATA